MTDAQEVGLHADRRPSSPHKRINCSATFKRAQKRLASICAKINYRTHPIFDRPIHHDVGGVFGTKVWIVPHLGALRSFTFNLSASALQRSTLRRKVNRGEHDAVPAELRRWVWAGGRKLKRAGAAAAGGGGALFQLESSA